MLQVSAKPLYKILLLSLAYIIAAKLGLLMAFEQANTSPVWPPTGIAIAAILYCGLRIWPGIFLGALIVNYFVSSSLLLSLSIAFGNTLEALLAGFIILHFASKEPFSKISDTAVFLVAIFISTMLGASIGIGSLLFADVIPQESFSILWKTWWVGDFVGGLIITPFVLIWSRPAKEDFSQKQIVEAVLLILMVLLALYITFGNFHLMGVPDELIAFSLLPLLAWSTLRFHQHGATLVIVITSAGAILGTVNGFGPFVLENENTSLLALQAYIGAAMFTALLLMAAQGERISAYQKIRQNEKNLENAISAQTTELQETNVLLAKEMQQQSHLTAALKSLFHHIDRASEENFFTRCTQTLSSIYKTKYAFVGTFDNKEQTRIKTLSVWENGQAGHNFTYNLKGTPCEDVLNNAMELVAQQAATRYPDDEMLISMSIESYYGAPLISNSGKVIGIMAVMDDKPLSVDPALSALLGLFSNRVALEIQRRINIEELELAASVFKESMEAIIICDAQANIIRVNPEFTKITGYSLAETKGEKPNFLKSGHHSETFYEQLWITLSHQGFWQGEITNKRKNGEIFISWQLIKVVKDEQGNIQQYISIMNDITEKKRAEEKIYTLAHHDLITQLPNRLSFHKRVKEEIAKALHSTNRLALMFIDLDNFKLINDTSGHPVGDELLYQVAIRLKEVIGTNNVISRFGGDEFTVLLPNINSTEDVSDVAHKILDSLLSPFILSSCEITISASIGIGIYPDNGHDVSSLLSCADNAMYRAKESGRSSFEFYTDQMQIDSHEQVILERDLRNALKAGEFILHYQPQIEIDSRRVIGVEALIRWQHPARGLIPPNIFIPIAEATGLIVPMGEWVIHEACQQLSIWISQGFEDLTMAVNLSARQFFQKNLLDIIENELQALGIPAQNLEFEITESMMMTNAEETVSTLQTMKNLGLQLSIDDFGTGYSSLSYLKRFPIDKLKIDKSFVDGLPKDADDSAIVEAIIAIAHALKLTVIAEGVETEEQYEVLSKFHCDEIQGYIFSKPQTPEHVSQTFQHSYRENVRNTPQRPLS
tara:strand:- start:2305 stop:5475 length:3171 start_codon:yes stop_codon:yes gene_type:complete